MTSDVDVSRRLRGLVAVLVGLEAVGLVGLAVLLVVETFVSTAADLGGAIALATLALLLGLGLGFCAYGLSQAMGWSRAPVVTWQLLQAGVAMPLTRTDRWYVGIPLLVAAAVVLVLLLTNRSITTPPPE